VEWSKLFEQTTQPTFEDITKFINNELWQKLNSVLHETYNVSPVMSYSKCSAQPGWNVKYKKGGKALCTLYPMEGFFIALVTIGNKEANEVELTLASYSDFTQSLYHRTPFSCGGRWLMMSVTDEDVLDDVVNLVNIRMRTK